MLPYLPMQLESEWSWWGSGPCSSAVTRPRPALLKKHGSPFLTSWLSFSPAVNAVVLLCLGSFLLVLEDQMSPLLGCHPPIQSCSSQPLNSALVCLKTYHTPLWLSVHISVSLLDSDLLLGENHVLIIVDFIHSSHTINIFGWFFTFPL